MNDNNRTVVTVGIPFYNSEKFLRLAIDSVILQTYQNWELVLIDDGSTDESLNIAKSFSDKRIRVISDGENKGISYRLNQLVTQARGIYFVRMDADDIMFPERIQKQIDFLQRNNSVDVVGSSAIVVDDENKILGIRGEKPTNNFIKLFSTVAYIHPTVCGKTEWFKKFKYREEFKGVEDLDLWIRSFNKSNFGYIDVPLLFYRDPLNFKIGTYRFRQKQKRKLYDKNKSVFPENKQLLQNLKYLSYLKELFAMLTVYTKILNKFVVKRRNKEISENKIAIYIDILKKIIG